MYLNLPSNIPKTLDIRRHRFRVMPTEAATSYFHQGFTLTYPNVVVIDLRIPCKGNIEGASAYVYIRRAQRWHQIYLVHEFWPKNDVDDKLKYIRKATTSSRMMKILKLEKIDKINSQFIQLFFCGENHIYYFTQANRILVLFAVWL